MFAEVVPGLFLGDSVAASDEDLLSGAGVTFVVNCAAADVPCYFESGDFQYLKLPLDDSPDEPLLSHVYRVTDFLDRSRREGGGALIHCEKGHSRAPTVLMCYLIQGLGMTLREAAVAVVSACRDVWPNPGFLKQLAFLERRALGSSSLPVNASALQTIAPLCL